MTVFIAGLIIFFSVHFYAAFRSRKAGRDLRKKWGDAKFMGIVSILSIVGFVLLIMGFGQARPSAVLYTPPSWGVHVNMLLMVLALIALVASQVPAGHIKIRLKHPMLVSIKLWALGHLISNGELVSVMLFGAFLAYAVVDRIAVKRRGDMGATNTVAKPMWDLVAVTVGLGIYAAFVMKLHVWLIGVPIIAG